MLSNKPSRIDPFGQRREQVGGQLIDAVLNELTLDEILQLGLRKLDNQEHYNSSQIKEKIMEAQFWLWEGERNLYQRYKTQAECETDTKEEGPTNTP